MIDNVFNFEGAAPAPEPKPEPTTCPLNQEYTGCGTACPITCANYKNPPQMCTMNCVVGCQCKSGYVQKGDGSCCLSSECWDMIEVKE